VMIEKAIEFGKPVRIGVNWGSLDAELMARMMDANAKRAAPQPSEAVMREALVASALGSAQRAEELGLPGDRIVLSCKVSNVQELIAVYRALAQRCDYPLHLGLTEAGMGSKGIVASTAAIAVLLQQGIGDTIRVSLTPDPDGERTKEVGTLKAIGFQRGTITALFLAEALVVACIGAVIGIGGALLIFRSIDLSLYIPNFISFIPTTQTLVAAFVMSILVGLVSVVYSAFRVSSLTIAEALRSTE